MQRTTERTTAAKPRAVVVGAGFGGLASAALLARDGFAVTVVEKNDAPGGRARVWREQGFAFDMGPSWYLMPEVFDDFFACLGRRREDYYRLVPLDPYYKIFFEGGRTVTITRDLEETRRVFEDLEAGGAAKLDRYLELARYKYDIAMREFMYVEYRSLFQFFNKRVLTQGLRMNIFSSLDRFVRRFFSERRARQILEYAMVFLGASPANAPALYSIMSHVDLNLGVFYPDGGFGSMVDGMVRLCRELGVEFRFGAEADGYEYEGKAIRAVRLGGELLPADLVLCNGDLHHAETALLPPRRAALPERWWRRRTLAPSMFILYLGLDRRLPGLTHHNLYFQDDWDRHFASIFGKPAWPDKPCFYLSCPSKTDPSVAPEGMENLFVLVPVAPGLDDGDARRAAYAEQVLAHVEAVTGQTIAPYVKVKRIYSQRDYAADYRAYRGTALGLAHTLDQTAIFRPAIRSKTVPNLFYAGQYTHPGVGVPMVLVAARLAARAAAEYLGLRKPGGPA